MLIPLDMLVRKYRIPPRTPVLHIGGHAGEEAADYAKHRMRPVWWVEADPESIPLLHAGVKRFPDQYVRNAAISDESGTAVFHRANNGQSSSLLDLGTHAKEHPDVVFVDSFTVKTTTIDDMFDGEPIQESGLMFGKVPAGFFLNLDIQGAELMALRGGERFLTYTNWVYAEVNRRALYKGCALLPDLDQFLVDHGFRLVELEMTQHHWGDGFWVKR